MLDRTAEQFDVTPSRLVADGGYGSAEMVGWLREVDERGIEPHVNLIDKAERTDGTFSGEPTSPPCAQNRTSYMKGCLGKDRSPRHSRHSVQRAEPRQGAIRVEGAGEPAVADHVGDQNRRDRRVKLGLSASAALTSVVADLRREPAKLQKSMIAAWGRRAVG